MSAEKITWVKYHRRDKPIPEGWRFLRDLLPSHHGYWSILIEKIEE